MDLTVYYSCVPPKAVCDSIGAGPYGLWLRPCDRALVAFCAGRRSPDRHSTGPTLARAHGKRFRARPTAVPTSEPWVVASGRSPLRPGARGLSLASRMVVALACGETRGA